MARKGTNLARKGTNLACKGTNLARKGNYSSTLTGRLRAQAWASSNHYSLVRPD